MRFRVRHCQRQPLIVGAVLLWLCLLACSPQEVAPTASPTVTDTPTPPIIHELPPTWTPSPTWTIQPSSTPTITPSPTVSPTATATLAESAICEQFAVTGQPLDGVQVAYAGTAGFSWEGAPADSVVVVALQTANTDEILVQFPYDGGFAANITMQSLPTWGEYTWQLAVLSATYGEKCTVRGTFFRLPWWQSPFPNPFRPPDSS